MTGSDALDEPLDGYNKVYKDAHLKYTEEMFDDLAKKSRVDIAANKKTVTEYKQKLAEIEKVKNSITKAKVLRVVLIILCAVLGVVGIIMVGTAVNGDFALWIGIVFIVFALIFIVASIVFITSKIGPTIKKNEEIRNNLQSEADKILNEAWAQMAGLNALYDWDIPQSLVTKTVPSIVMDNNFDEERFIYLREKFGFKSNLDATRSTQFCQSGAILGNPFLVLKDLKQNWVQHTYTGSIVIHWTSRQRTKQGTRTVHHSQVLYASIRKPKPVYNYDTYLVYGNEAAPNLTFSRKPSGVSGLSDKKIEKKVASKANKLDKKARKAVGSGDGYTRLGNDEFETLFGGTDRNNEVEYRMLFTPLAQRSLLKLIKTPQPYGDDFTIQKIKKLNYLRSKHSQGFDYEVDPVNFISYDFEAARENFININTTYFKSLYFDLAPLISIPLYHQQKTREFIYDMPYASNVSCYEHESIANSFKKELLRPQGAATPSILKTRLIKKEDDADSVMVTAYAFRAERRISYIPRLGGDGRMHAVPVVWIEYFPVERNTLMAVHRKQSSRPDINMNSAKSEFKQMLKNYSYKGAWLYERGVFAMLTGKPITADAVREMNGIYGAAAGGVAVAETEADAEELAFIIREEAARHDRSNNPDTDADELLKDESAETREVEVREDEIGSADDNSETN